MLTEHCTQEGGFVQDSTEMGWMYEISREADMKSWDEGTGCTGGEAMRCDDAVPSRLETTEYRRSRHNPIPQSLSESLYDPRLPAICSTSLHQAPQVCHHVCTHFPVCIAL